MKTLEKVCFMKTFQQDEVVVEKNVWFPALLLWNLSPMHPVEFEGEDWILTLPDSNEID